MTTIIAIVAGYFFYAHAVWWAFVVVLIIGLIQASTKSTMNFQFRSALARGLPAQIATDTISNVVTQINMISTFVIWGFGVYAAVIKFL
jgi:hypothetical protein